MDNFFHQDQFFDGLLGVLRENPELNKPTNEESAALKKATGGTPKEELEAARIFEELGQYKVATALYESRKEVEAKLALARIARYLKDWKAAEKQLVAAEALPKNASAGLDGELAMERGYRLLAQKKYDDLRDLLVAAIKANPGHDRVPEMHYYAGVACHFLKRKEWANFHWGWVMTNTPDDRHYMRAYSAATSEASPFPNPELDTDPWKSGEITQDSADAARLAALKDYERLKDAFAKDDYWSSKTEAPPKKSEEDGEEEGF